MSNRSELSQLIGTMSLQERLQFENRWAEPESNYLQLFKWLCEKDIHDNEELQNRLDKTGISQPLSQIKKKLKEQVTKYLIYRLLNSGHQHYENWQEYLLIKSLQTRGISESVVKRAGKLQQSALSVGDYHTYLNALEIELFDRRNDVNYVNKAVDDYNNAMDTYQLLGKTKMAILKLNTFRREYLFSFNAVQVWHQLKNTLPQPVIQTELIPADLHLASMLLNARWLYYIAEYNQPATYQCANQMRDWLHKQPEYLKNHMVAPMMYSFKLMAAIEFADHKTFYEDYQEIMPKITEWNSSFAGWEYLGVYKLLWILVNNQLHELPQILAERETFYTQKKLTASPVEYIPRLLQLNGQYLEALQHLSDNIEKEYKPQKNLMSENYSRIDELMILTDMGSTSVIASKTEAYRKWLNRKLPNTEQESIEYLIIRYFPKLHDLNGQAKKNVYHEFLEKLLAYPNQQHPILNHFLGGLIPWVQAKLENRYYHEVVQEIIQRHLVAK